MRRTRVSAPAVLAAAAMTVLGLLLGSVGVASLAAGDRPLSHVRVQAQATLDVPSAVSLAAPGHDESKPRSLTEGQRRIIGGIGAVLLLLVLLGRKARGKAMFGVRWRRRG